MSGTPGLLGNQSASTSASTKDDVQTSTTQPQGQAPAGKAKKHRRTRNGCYICRVRRIKCDETHPICVRCQKANRPCKFPEPRSDSTRKSASKGTSDDDSESKNFHQTQDAEHSDKGAASEAGNTHRPKTEDLAAVNTESRCSSDHSADESPALEHYATPESNPNFSSLSLHLPRDGFPYSMQRFLHLTPDLQFYLHYHLTCVNFHHYFFKQDADHFLHTSLIDKALSFEPLLYALAGFAAFQHAVTHGRISESLQYYNRSASILRHSLASGNQHCDATLLTVLQLATFEEYLGDWVSLLSHQQAAFRLLTEIFNTSSILETDLSRKILDWFLRFDLTSGILSGSVTLANREWYTAISDYYSSEAERHPEITEYKIQKSIFQHRVTCKDLGDLFANTSKGEVPRDFFQAKCQFYAHEIESWKDSLDPIFSDTKYQVRDPRMAVGNPAEDSVGPFKPVVLYSGALSAFNFMCADYIAIRLILELKRSLILGLPLSEELPILTVELCRIFETIDSPLMPAEAILKAQGILGIASLFLPKDERHIQWCCKKLAKIERLGHIYPTTFRRRMAETWDRPELDWWAENEEEIPSLVRNIRAFQEYKFVSPHQRQRDQDQREMRGIFERLRITEDDVESPAVGDE